MLNIESEEINFKKMMEPSIFDDLNMKDIKLTMMDLQEFINEC
jgi:hypothetical protein